MLRKKPLFFILVILTLFSVYSVSIGVATPNERLKIKIGALGPLAITPGNDMKNGVEMAVDEINSGDGVNVGGVIYDFELITRTTSGDLGIPDPSVGVASAVQLIDSDNVTAIIGGFRTEVVLGVQMSTSVSLDRPFLGIGASAPIVSPHFWRIGPSNVSGLARNVIDFYAYGLIPDEGVRNITIIRESAAWTLAMALGIKQACIGLAAAGFYGAGVTVNFTDDIIIPVDYQQDEVTNAFSVLTGDTYQGLELNALCTIFSGPVGGYVPVAWAAHDLPMFLAGINVESQVSTFFDETEGACYGEIELETCPPDVEPNENTAPFRAKYFSLYDEQPTYTAFASYDAVYVLKAAIEAANSLNYADIETALANIEVQGTAYTIKFTSEPGPHWTVAENTTTGLPYYVPILTSAEYPEGVPIGTFLVHDLYTNASYGMSGRPYNVGYWAQWQQGGIKKTIWHDPTKDAPGYLDVYSPMDNQRNLTAGNLVWPINHAEHGWEPEPEPTTEVTTGVTETITTEGTETTEEETTTSEEPVVEVPGFDLQIALFVMCSVAVIFYKQKQKKR
ncbi:MAG: ABC transporter substrate-binding protein [Promethearchaeota archaeon]